MARSGSIGCKGNELGTPARVGLVGLAGHTRIQRGIYSEKRGGSGGNSGSMGWEEGGDLIFDFVMFCFINTWVGL